MWFRLPTYFMHEVITVQTEDKKRERKGGRKALDSVGLNLEAWIFNHCLTSRITDKSCLK